jgi:outer membrane lipoprotein-sorting protein
MRGRIGAVLAALAGVSLAAGMALAQDTKKPMPPNPVGAGTWGQTVTKEANTTEATPADVQLTPQQIEIIKRVSRYFNELPDLKGAFVQTNADNKRLRGKFHVKRPSFFRFDYAPPSKMVILSDGQYMIIQDNDLKTDDRVPLDQTAFRLLLRKDVDLLRDARVLEVQEVEDLVLLVLQDKNPDTPGRIKLFLAKKPSLELKEWVTTDPQGLDTRVELLEVVKGDVDPALFKPAPVYLQKLQ